VSGEFDLWREDPAGGADYLFFPGCQLAAGAPQYIAPLYQHLRQILPGGVGLGLSCCGAPAHWAGQQELKQQTREKLMAEWRRLGQPILITGCTTCYQEFLPVIGAEKLTTVWDVLAQYGLPPQETALPGHVFAIHDPCTSRQMGETQANLRKIAVQLGCRIREMPHSGADTRCCGYGGLAIFGNPQLTQELQQQRLAETDQDLLTYCWVCRDYLGAAAEKQGRYGTVYHLMDLLFGGGIPAPRADISTKRANRRWLKQELLQQLWGEGTSPVSSLQKYRLVAGLPLLLEQRLILIEDIAAVVEQAEQSGYKLIRPGVGHYIAHLRRGIVTYWVEYSITAEGYLIHNAYSHRIQLLTEGLNY
ncbi:MAG: (Fe-S)-binding protein, partial [Clostridiales bacterium]